MKIFLVDLESRDKEELSILSIKGQLISKFQKTNENKSTWGIIAGVSSLGVPGVPWHHQILADQLTPSQQVGQIMPIK